MSDIFREVEEDLNRARAVALLKKYGVYVAAAVVVLVLGFVGNSIWQAQLNAQKAKQSEQFMAALQTLDAGSNPGEAAKSFEELSNNASGGYKILSQFLQAEGLILEGRDVEALSVYESIVLDSRADKVMRDLARVKAAYMVADTASLDEMTGRVASLMDGKNPWRFSAREVFAVTAYRTGDIDRARVEYMRLLGDPGTPQNMRARADEMLGVIGFPEPEQSSDEDKTGSGENTKVDQEQVVN